MALFIETGRMYRLQSAHSDDYYTIDAILKTCTCESFKRGGAKDAHNGECKHLEWMGLFRSKPYTHKTHPTFAQALSGLVKSLRIRRAEEAVYWLTYLYTFKDPKDRFRVARRLLIGTAEDGHCIPTMEKCAENFPMLCAVETPLVRYVAEAVRICKSPNWWDPATGGHDYIFNSLLGIRNYVYLDWDHSLDQLKKELESAFMEGDRAPAIGSVMSFKDLKETYGSSKQATLLSHYAAQRKHDLAFRLINVHLKCKGALSGDNNFLCQAAWMMAGGSSPIALDQVSVTGADCYPLMEAAAERWKDPKPIPSWCCDGLHCAGDDTRFAGMLPCMMAVCKAYRHYGRVDPADKWLPQFDVYTGLRLQKI